MVAGDDNRVVQSLWVGGRLSALERLCVRSFCAHGHEFHLYHYDELENVPRVDGLRLMNAEEILPRTAMFNHVSNKPLAFFADHFRWELLRQRGGWWADMDMICLRPLDFTDEVVLACVSNKPLLLNIAIMKFPHGHAAAEAAAGCYANVDRWQPWDSFRTKKRKLMRRLMFWGDSRRRLRSDDAGSMGGLTAIVRHFGLEKHVRPVHIFHWLDMGLLDYAFDNTLHDIGALESMFSQSYAVHLSQSGLPALGIDKDAQFPDNSLYEILKRRYGVL